ncbi:hypothetical protein HPB47_005323, partial [Ixodes persulcatus]
EEAAGKKPGRFRPGRGVLSACRGSLPSDVSLFVGTGLSSVLLVSGIACVRRLCGRTRLTTFRLPLLIDSFMRADSKTVATTCSSVSSGDRFLRSSHVAVPMS